MAKGAKPGENRFADMQREKINSTKLEIDKVLSILRHSKVRFDNITSLANYIARTINEKSRHNEKPRRIHYTTLLRQTDYRVKLDAFLASRSTTDAKVEKFITDLERQELFDLRSENRRLSEYINKHLQEVTETIEMPVKSDCDKDQLCRVISLLLEASDGMFVIDPTGEIVKAWARSKRNRTVVPADLAREYIEWQKSFLVFEGNNSDA